MAAHEGRPPDAAELAAIACEVTGKGVLSGEASSAALSAASAATMEYEDMRSTIAERYHGWTFAVIDEMDFDAISDAWRHLAGKRKPPPMPQPEPPTWSWRHYLNEVLGDDPE